MPDGRFGPPISKSNFSEWKKSRFLLCPNTRIDISFILSGLEFHKQIGNFIERKEPSFLFQGLKIANIFMTLFNLLGLPSDIIEYSMFYNAEWGPLMPEKFLLYPNRLDYLKKLLIKEDPIKELAKNRYYFNQIDPRTINFSKLEKLWLKYHEILKEIDSHSPLRIVCRSLTESYKKDQTVDIFIEFMIGLEALFGTSEQISYKLPLLISSLYPSEQRNQIFELLRDLYQLRSQIIHGEDHQKVLKKVINKQSEINSFDDIIGQTRTFLIDGILVYMDLLLKLPKNLQKVHAKAKIIEKLETRILSGSSKGLLDHKRLD